MKPALPLLALTVAVALASCGGTGDPPGGGGTDVCAQTVSAGAALPASVTAASVLPTTVPAPDWTAPHVPGRVLVLNTDGTLGAQSLGLLSTVRTQRVTEGLTLALTPAGETDRAFAGRLAAAGARVQPDFLYRSLATPDDPGYPGNGGVDLGFTNVSQTYLTRIRASGAWDVLGACGKTPGGALTAVLDTGADGGHRDLQGRLLGGRSFVSGESSATVDLLGHGTASVGLIGAATNNGVGLAGVTWSGRNLLPVKVLGADGGSTSAIAQGINYAVAQGAKVINLSLGTPGNPGDKALETALNNAARTAVLVAAAGNTPGVGGYQGVYYPASNPNVIAVGAVGASDRTLACYSERPTASQTRPLDLVAPGGAASGFCPGATRDQDLLVLSPGSAYGLSAGTSDAAPLVSGVAALVRAANPDLTAPQTRALLVGSANASGGLPLLDAQAAVSAALR
ncbi:S8 family serine peptidase [Deinococcus planocerae]|uniref:S8 family serine peptidase n=1 Tax=Deinococcus planocerae TaxID=1737569 RepID=UPI000C7F48C6|nr:S8 family serine peptidase [Deinococcus planocerae]